MIETQQPTTSPLDVPAPKPSESQKRSPLDVETALPSAIVRNWPDAMWTANTMRRESAHGGVRFCVIGIMAETGGFDWSMDTGDADAVYDWVGHEYGLSDRQIHLLWHANDFEGKAAAADLLDSWGL